MQKNANNANSEEKKLKKRKKKNAVAFPLPVFTPPHIPGQGAGELQGVVLLLLQRLGPRQPHVEGRGSLGVDWSSGFSEKCASYSGHRAGLFGKARGGRGHGGGGDRYWRSSEKMLKKWGRECRGGSLAESPHRSFVGLRGTPPGEQG